MKNKIYYSVDARRDLDDIWDHIAADLCNPVAAEGVVSRILDAVDQLESFPEIGAPLGAVADARGDYRYLVAGNYLAFYRVAGNDIYVDRVLYGRRDYLRILFGDVTEEELPQR